MSAQQPLILLVEDDEAIRETLVEVLREEGMDTRAAAHGKAALALLEGGCRPDLILLDLMMPVMDGWQLVDRLRARPEWAHLRVLVLSASQQAIPTGVQGMLSKPLDLDALLEAIGAHARGQRPEDAAADRAEAPRHAQDAATL